MTTELKPNFRERVEAKIHTFSRILLAKQLYMALGDNQATLRVQRAFVNPCRVPFVFAVQYLLNIPSSPNRQHYKTHMHAHFVPVVNSGSWQAPQAQEDPEHRGARRNRRRTVKRQPRPGVLCKSTVRCNVSVLLRPHFCALGCCDTYLTTSGAFDSSITGYSSCRMFSV